MTDRYHVNPKTGNTGICKAHYSCPFGNLESAHFDDAAAAREFFESTQTTFPAKVKKRDSVFRVGLLEPSKPHFLDLLRLVKAFDQFVPEGRQKREGAIFASPDMKSHLRWIKGSSLSGQALDSHEISINPNQVYVYPVDIYEGASVAESQGFLTEFEALTKEYWESGMNLTEWRAWAIKASPQPGSWELLIPEAAIESSRAVSSRRIIESADDDNAREINWLLEPRRASKGKIWRKNLD